jgi:anaerobic dimethyl sulfoxide reductase subunit B (iron-sulfur subunit)
MAKQMGFYFDASICTGCKACQIACQDRHDLGADVLWRRVFHYGGGGWVPDPDMKGVMMPSNIFVYSLSTACQHCQKPLCVEVCPTAAMAKHEDGTVLIDTDKCIGCRYCEWACPYGGPQYNEAAGVMTKCDSCYDIRSAGGNPVCVDACVMRALDFGDLDELRAKHGNVSAIEPLPPADITDPSLVITPHHESHLNGTGQGRIINIQEEM